MERRTKIVIVGAASMSFGLSMLRDIFASGKFAGSTLTLVGRAHDGLERMERVARFLDETHGGGLTIEATIDRRAAFDGAKFVANAVAIDRNRLWRRDFEVPRKHGIRHTLGENGGPGGLFFTLRTLPLIFDIVRDMEAVCPDALLINFSNPETRVIQAVGRYSRIKAIGLCHGVFLAQHAVARIIGLPADDVDVRTAGLNHFGCLVQIRHRRTGADLYPRLREREPDYDPSFAPLTRKLFRAFGYWLGCGDSHVGEYLAYGWQGGERGYDFDADEQQRIAFRQTVDEVLAGKHPIPPWWLTASGERGAAVIAGVSHNENRFIESGIVINQGAIPNLPADAAVEVPVMADASGVHPVCMGPLPDPIARMLATQVNVQQLAVEAAAHASKELALQSLLIDPVVPSIDAAIAVLDELWEYNRPYIRPFV